MNQYFVILGIYNRNDTVIGKHICVVTANTEQEARDLVWKQHRADNYTIHDVKQFDATEVVNDYMIYYR